MELVIPELNNVLEKIEDLKTMIKDNETPLLTKQWYNDEQCWNLKGGGALSSFRAHRYYQPKGGIPDAKVGGRKVWSKETVQEWLLITDDQLDDYHLKYKTGATRKD